MQLSYIEYYKNGQKYKFELHFSLRADMFKRQYNEIRRVLSFKGVLPESQPDIIKMMNTNPDYILVNGTKYEGIKDILLVEDGEYVRTTNLEIHVDVNLSEPKELKI